MLELVLFAIVGIAVYFKRDYLRLQLKRVLSRPDSDIGHLIEDSKASLKAQFDKLYELKAINACLKEDLAEMNAKTPEYVSAAARIDEHQKLIDKSESILKDARERLISFEAKKSSLILRQGTLDIRNQLFDFTSSLGTDCLASQIGKFEQNLRVQEKKIELMERDNV